MRYKPGHKEETRSRILDAAGRGFRRHGYEGIGVDGLAREAGVTSGAFYTHFGSKADAFAEAAQAGLEELRQGIEALQAEHGPKWIEAFADHYLGFKRTCDLSQACGLQSLTPEVMRADAAVRSGYETAMLAVVDAVAKGLPQATPAERRQHAWALLALLSGGVTMARVLNDEAAGAKAAKALRAAALALARG